MQAEIVREDMLCFGGPLNGKVVPAKPDLQYYYARDLCPDYRPDYSLESHVYELQFGPTKQYDWSQVVYVRHDFHERRGAMIRSIRCMVPEGSEKEPILLRRIECSLRERPWRPLEKPNFLREFDRWFNLKMYEITGEERYLWMEYRI